MNSLWQAMMSNAQKRGPEPHVTWHGVLGRIELSVTTYVNAGSKTGNFLVEGLMLDESSSVRVELGTHWQSSVWLGALMVAGIQATDSPDADLTIATKDVCAGWPDDPDKLVIVTRDPFGMPDRDADETFANASAPVRTFGASLSPPWPLNPSTLPLKSTDVTHTWEQLAQLADEVTGQFNIVEQSRYGLRGSGSLEQHVALQVLLPLLNRSSVVLIDQDFVGDLDTVTKDEHISHIVSLGAAI